ncbi:MAG: OmpA family protein [Verrucomicrobiales bacterium]|nr:OmpA family protein [Verrucomicrobiales bacterium]
MNRVLKTCLIGLAFYAVLLWVSVGLLKPRIELQLNEKLISELDEIGDICEGFSFELSGRDCSITGGVYTGPDRDRIISSIRSIVGIRKIDDGLTIIPLKNPSISLTRIGGNSWKLDGRILVGDAAAQLTQAFVRSIGEGVDLQTDFQEESNIADLPPLKKVESLFVGFCKFIPNASGLGLSERRLTLIGKSFSEARRDQALDFARSQMSDHGYDIIDEIIILPPTDDPSFQISDSSDGILVSGLLKEFSFKDRIFNLIRQTDEQKTIKDELHTGDHVRNAEWGPSLLRVIPALVAEVDKLKVNLSSESIVISGIVDGDEKKRSLEQLTEQSFEGKKGSFKIVNELVVFVPPEKASLTMSWDEDGSFNLKGLLSQRDLYAQFLSATSDELKDKNKELKDKIELKENVEKAPWVNRMATLVGPFMAAVQWGALSVRGDEVALEAEVIDSGSGDILKAMVEKAFPVPDYKRIIQINVVEPAGPTDEEIMTLENTMMDTVIYFDTESSKIKAKETKKIEPLVEAFLKVPGSSIALLGHADSYGNANYNRKLGRKRCESVRNSLVGLGVNRLLIEIEVKGESEKVVNGRKYESGRRVEFELR